MGHDAVFNFPHRKLGGSEARRSMPYEVCSFMHPSSFQMCLCSFEKLRQLIFHGAANLSDTFAVLLGEGVKIVC